MYMTTVPHAEMPDKRDQWIHITKRAAIFTISTAVPYILIISKSFIYQLMHNRDALKEY